MALDPSHVCGKLNDLIMLDYDAIKAYQSAIDRIEVGSIRSELESFRKDHERHVQVLSHEVRKLGGTPASRRDLKGPFIQGFTAIMAMMGIEEALRAMKTNEQLTTRSYANALKEVLPDDCRRVVEANFADEQRHLAYIEAALRDRIWEGIQPVV
jgi:uncharacterized protein (TIGR02284 family)